MTDLSTSSAPVESEFRVGRVFNRTFSVLFRGLPRFFAVCAVAYVPSFFVTKIFTVEEETTITAPAAVFILLAVLLAEAFNLLGQAVVLHAAFQQVRRQPVRLVQSLKVGVVRILPLVGLVIVELLLIAVASLAFIIPAFILFAMWAVTLPVCVVERRGPFASLSRSTELTRGHRWKVFALIFPVFVVDVVMSSFLDDTLSSAGGTPLM